MTDRIKLFVAAFFGAAAAFAAEPQSKASPPDAFHPYTCISAAAKAIEAGENPGTGLLFQAALAADLAGDAVKSRDFLTYMLEKDKGDSPEVRRALVRMCLAGGDPKYFERYLSIAPHDLDALTVGLRQFESFVREGKARDYAHQLQTLLNTWPEGEEFDSIVRSIYWAVYETNAMGISDGRNTLKILAKNTKWKLTARMDTFFSRCLQYNRFSSDFVDMWRARKNQTWPRDVLERLVGAQEVSEAEAVDILRQICQLYGVERKNAEGYLNHFHRVRKNPAFAQLVADAKAGKFPEKGANPRHAFNNAVRQWVGDCRAKKFDGKPAEAMKRAAEVFTKGTVADAEDTSAMGQFCELASRIAVDNPKAASLYPFEGFAKWVFERPYHDIHGGQYSWIFKAYEAAGKLPEAFARVRKAADAAGTAQGAASRRMAQAALVDRGDFWKPFLAEANYDWNKKTFTRPAPAQDRLLWCLEHVRRFAKAPIPELIWHPDHQGANWDAYWRCESGAQEAKREMTEAEKKYRSDMDALLRLDALAAYPNGCQRLGGPWGCRVPVEAVLAMAAESEKVDPALPRIVASVVRTGRGEGRDILSAAKKLMEKDQVELAYLLVSRHRDIDKNPELQKIRTEAAGRMPGLYPVSEKDPAYPLYVAADALACNNPERAWSLLSANTKTFDKDPMRYQPQFALWALEQYRKVRGTNDALRDRAWEHVETLLQKESSLPAEVAAGLFLLRAEIAEDRLQYEIAHAGYQALRNHAQYKGTKAGRAAMFKDVELMMTMGSLDGAAQAAEQWITASETDVRAQGHYVLAKIAFARKDYDETRKELEKVFEIDFTHAEARLLQGEWKLATNYEVDDTQVLLGDLADRSAIRPGQPLSITVQDRNLSVAGGGASIPVLVTTTGGDREKILLYPGTRDPALFRGAVDTVLGVAKAGNSKLELSGDDTVSYQIDPEYLAGRGLPASKAKLLTVVDDAELTVGTGDESRNLRPGLPLHVKLVDRDRSRKTGAASVEVQVMTSSGDRLPAAKLVETGVCTGEFVAEIKTAIPPPRAFASDSAAGKGPQDLVSKSRGAVWESLADGEKPKFVGVDTMSSYMVSSTTVEMGSPETIARLRLFGTLFGEEILLGTFPSENASSRKGIRHVSLMTNVRNRTDFLRELSKRLVTPTPLANWSVRRTQNGHSGIRHLVRGTVFVPADTRMQLRIKPLTPDAKNPGETIRFLGAELLVDGAKVFGANEWDAGYKAKSHAVTFDAGIHDFELYATTCRPTDSFELCQELDSGELVSLPADWTDEKAHPELLARLTDKCSIAKGKGGFTATFAKPERLRTLRWEFTDFSGNSVSAKKLHVTDKTGHVVVPAEHDYTEALGNDILEVAPGDTITVTYEDAVTSSGRARAVERKISSAFANGTISFLSEDIRTDARGRSQSFFNEAYRVAPGDTVIVKVVDPDLDVTKGADRVKIVVESTSGKKIALYACERTTESADGEASVLPRDQGVFYAQVRTTDKAGENLPPGTIFLKAGEGLKAAYKDDDNTNPGVPVPREATLAAVSANDVALSLGNTWTERAEDKSPEGEARLASIRRRRASSGATKVWRSSSYAEYAKGGEAALVTPETELPISLRAPGLVRHAGSTVVAKVATRREIDSAAAENREVAWREVKLGLAPVQTAVRFKAASGSKRDSKYLPETLKGFVELYTSAAEERAAGADDGESEVDESKRPVDAKAGDEIVVRCVDASGATIAEATAKIATTAWMGLADATYEAENASVHLGEPFHVMVIDPDRDATDEQDEVSVQVVANSGGKRTLSLKETMPRSGVFTGIVTPSIETNATEDVSRFRAAYGDTFTFTYADESAGLNGKSGTRTSVGTVLPGSDGAVRAYSKRFRDADQAVLVQFRLAECLFEMAKEYRRLKDTAKSAEAIADGRRILEAALRDYPNTKHAAEGEFLLANLSEQLAEEARQRRVQREKDGEDVSKEKDESEPLYREAVARFSSILAAWPEGEYAARSQYHKALCLERLGDFARASEEYVKMTYVFPESPLVGDASVRLASYYYKKEQRYDIAGKIYTSFRSRFPAHPQAPNALFMGGQCLVKQAEKLADGEDVRGKDALVADAYKSAVESFVSLVENYRDIPNKELLAQGLYWAGDISFRLKDYPNAYIYLKRTTFEYPESKWARYARGMLLQEASSFEEVAQ